MEEKTKQVNVDFFTGRLDEESDRTIEGALAELAAMSSIRAVWLGSHRYELRNVKRQGGFVRGALAKFRLDDLPHAGRVGGAERELDLADDEGLLEKNHFLFDERRKVLAFQRNGNASRVGQLGKYLTELFGETIEFDPVVQKDALARLMKGDLEARVMELSFARPTNADVFPENDFNEDILKVLGKSGAARAQIRLSSDKRAVDDTWHHLNSVVKDFARDITRSGLATTARVTVDDDGIEYPIDLIADRVVSIQNVKFNGRYPVEKDMYRALNDGLDEQRDVLDEIFGPPDRRLR